MYIGKAKIPRATSLRLRELYARMHLVNYKKKIKFWSQSVASVEKESSCLAADLQCHNSLCKIS